MSTITNDDSQNDEVLSNTRTNTDVRGIRELLIEQQYQFENSNRCSEMVNRTEEPSRLDA